MKILVLFILLLSGNLFANSLVGNYQKELAFLIAQKRTLQKQIKQQKRKFQRKISAASKKVTGHQNKLVMLTGDNERLINKLTDAERSLENSESNKSLVETTISQGELTLGLKLDNRTEDQKIDFLFETAMLKLEEAKSETNTRGSFFLLDGTKVSGKILKYGNIARFGTYKGKTHMLMPVGGGKFKVVPHQESINIKNSSVLPVFLYESPEKGIEIKKEQSFMEMIDAGGAIAYIIVVLGGLAVLLMALRGIMLFRAGRVDTKLVSEIEAGDVSNLKLKLVKTNTPFSRVMKNTYEVMDQSLNERENVIQESILGELNFLDKFGAVILVMAAVAPLLGLLGTVTGMISTFDIITEFGTGDPKMLSSGISEALITTKLGLMVAIPTLLVGNLFSGWSNKIKIMLEREALRLSNLASKFAKKEAHA